MKEKQGEIGAAKLGKLEGGTGKQEGEIGIAKQEGEIGIAKQEKRSGLGTGGRDWDWENRR